MLILKNCSNGDDLHLGEEGSDDQSLNTDKEQSAANKENDDQMENGEEIAFPLEKECC